MAETSQAPRLKEIVRAPGTPQARTVSPAQAPDDEAGQYSLDLEVFAYLVTTNYFESLEIAEDLHLRIMDLVAAAGSELAIPAHIEYKTAGTGLDEDRARATNVVRYFIEQGGVNRESFEAVGYADTRPVADNETDAGRTENRRIEIVLFPKELSAIVGELKP